MQAEDFLPSASNRDALTWLQSWPEKSWPGGGLIIHGPTGSGKSHLAKIWQSQSRAIYMSPDSFIEKAGQLMTENQSTGFLVVDDVDGMFGHKEAEEVLFHLYNRIKAQSGALLLTMKLPPAMQSITLPDLRTRLMALPSVAIALPDDELLRGLLLKQCRDRQLGLHPDAMDYLLSRLERTASAAAEIAERLDHLAMAEKKRGISLPMARRALEDMIAARQIEMSEVS